MSEEQYKRLRALGRSTNLIVAANFVTLMAIYAHVESDSLVILATVLALLGAFLGFLA